MGSLSISHWVIVLVVAVLLFGRGRISETMGDFGKGILSFRKGLTGEEEVDVTAPAQNNETLPAISSEPGPVPVRPE